MTQQQSKIEMWRIPAMRKCAILDTLKKVIIGIELDDTVQLCPDDVEILQGVATGRI